MPRAGLTPTAVTAAAAELLDEVGATGLSMGLLAERLGVKAPSLYKHVDSIADLVHRIAIQAADELADAIRDAIAGKAGSEALAAGAQAMRAFFAAYPGRAAAASSARPSGPEDPIIKARSRVLESYAAVLSGYRLDAVQQVHAVRMLRSVLQGFTELEAADGFQFDTSTDVSFDWMVALIDRGLRDAASAGHEAAGAPRAG